MSPPYKYSPLESLEHIRLIHLKPGARGESIVCEIHHASLADPPFYQALSYAWDVDKPTREPPQYHSIACGESQIPVAPNLFSALQHLRQVAKDIVLWVDAICINQAHNQERGQQVRIMHCIYATSSCVLVWLGEAGPKDAIAFDLVQRIHSFSSIFPTKSIDLSENIHDAIETGLLPPLDGAPWEALASLLNKRYFYRVWVLQEVVAASAVIFNCGTHTVDWATLLIIVDFLTEPAVTVGPSLVAARQGLFMLNTIRSIRRRVEEGPRFTTIDVFMITRVFDASDARDKLYGLMGIIHDEAIVQPSYDLPPAKLFTETTIHNFVNEKSFACLSFADPSFSPDDGSLPSWVPKWSSLSKFRCPFAEEAYGTRFNTATEPFKPHQLPTVSNDCRILAVEGLEIDAIEILGGPHNIPTALNIKDISMRDTMVWRLRECLAWLKECEDIVKNGSPHAHSSDTLVETFWHTITLNGFPGSPILPSKSIEYYQSFKKAAEVLNAIEEPSNTFYQDLNRLARDASRFEQAITRWSPHRLFGKTQKGYLGMFPEGSVKGDIVCAIIGAPTPFVLRPEEGGTYRFVGEAYVHGLMNGEIFSFPDFEGILKKISIR